MDASPGIGRAVAPIVACATPWGRSAIALVRISGEGLLPLLQNFCEPVLGERAPRQARLCKLRDRGGIFDEGLLTFFPAPRSYTGEEVAEISCHGNPLIVERLLAAAVSAGARVADPGEFTRRAFLNGRMDLARAEAVLQSIEASTPEGLRIAREGLDGGVSALVDRLRSELTEAVAELEARLDYPAEDLTFEEDEHLAERLHTLREEALSTASTYQAGRILVDGARVALVGPVNAGKSSLFNKLGGSVRALVSPIAGTTRDVLERRVVLGSVAVTLLDTAGDRETQDPIEAAGVALGRELVDDADLFVVVLPAHSPEEAESLLERTRGRRRILVGNHADHPGAVTHFAGEDLLMTCATDGRGVIELADHIAEALIGEIPGGALLVIASQRQRDLLIEVAERVEGALSALVGAPGVAVAAEELYAALERLDALVGRDTRGAVLDALFKRFCIGK